MKNVQPTKAELRIVAGSLRGRKISTVVQPGLRPTPQRVRESLFSIMGNAIPERIFFDVFAGTGVVGLEAISRGATEARFIEGDARAGAAIAATAERWGVGRQCQVLKVDAYRWAERWLPPGQAVNLFLSPPFPDLEPARIDRFLGLIELLRMKLPAESVLTLQVEEGFPLERLHKPEAWDVRKYGRNILAFLVIDKPRVTHEPPQELIT